MVWAVLWGCVAAGAVAQQVGTGQMVNGQVAGVIFGSVTDSAGDLVPGAEVTLTTSGVEGERTTTADSEGRFEFSGVAPGTFEIKATAKGWAGGAITGELAPGAVFNAPPVKLQAAASSVITVTPQTEQEIATEEVRVEEKQRVLGIVPNYFVTYDLHPAPLSSKQKYALGLRAIFDPTRIAFSAGTAGVEQLTNTFPGYGTGPRAYGQRFGASLATGTTSSLLRDSLLPSLFHQDPRYYYKGTGTTWERTKYALATAVICKGDNGRWQPNYSGLLGSMGAGALANVYYAPSDRNGAALTFENGLISIAGEGFDHLMQEFVLRRFTSHAPKGTAPVGP